MARRRLDADAWVRAALRALVNEGLGAVAVEALARTLGATKGSFYWHFADRDALLGAVVDRWVEQTDALVAEVSGLACPRERLRALIAGAHRAERTARTVRAMGLLAEHPAVGARVKAVARRRHAFLAACFGALGFAPCRAEARNA